MSGKRKKGSGTIRLRKDGRWEGRVVIGYDEAGSPKTKNVLAKTKRECAEKLKKLKEQCGAEMRFGDWLEYWYQNFSKPKLRQSTQLSYEGWIYNRLIPGVGDIPLNKLTQADLQTFFRSMKEAGRMTNVDKCGKGLSDRSVRSCYAVCQMALDKAVEERLIHSNPAIGCKLPPLKGKEMKILTQEEIQRFLIQAKAEGMYLGGPGLRHRKAPHRQTGQPGRRQASHQRTENKGRQPHHHPAARHGGGAGGVQKRHLL